MAAEHGQETIRTLLDDVLMLMAFDDERAESAMERRARWISEFNARRQTYDDPDGGAGVQFCAVHAQCNLPTYHVSENPWEAMPCRRSTWT